MSNAVASLVVTDAADWNDSAFANLLPLAASSGATRQDVEVACAA
jgi:hypothetical protein